MEPEPEPEPKPKQWEPEPEPEPKQREPELEPWSPANSLSPANSPRVQLLEVERKGSIDSPLAPLPTRGLSMETPSADTGSVRTKSGKQNQKTMFWTCAACRMPRNRNGNGFCAPAVAQPDQRSALVDCVWGGVDKFRLLHDDGGRMLSVGTNLLALYLIRIDHRLLFGG